MSRGIAIVTGASSGIGAATVSYLHQNGFTVYGGCRRTMCRDNGAVDGVCYLPLDVTSHASVEAFVAEVLSCEGRIDALVNCAGNGVAGSVEDCTLSDAEAQFSVNYFGVLRVSHAVLPTMRAQKSGVIVNIGSVAGLFPIPYQSLYSASKFAIEALTECLRMELRPFGVTAVLVEPGDTKTGFTASRAFASAAETSPYAEATRRAVGRMEKDEQNGAPPSAVARCVLRALTRKHPPVRIVVGFGYKIFVFLKRVLPSRLINFILGKMYG